MKRIVHLLQGLQDLLKRLIQQCFLIQPSWKGSRLRSVTYIQYTVAACFFVWYYLKAHGTNQGWTCNCCRQKHLSKARATRKMIFTSSNSSSLNFWLNPNSKVLLCFHKVVRIESVEIIYYILYRGYLQCKCRIFNRSWKTKEPLPRDSKHLLPSCVAQVNTPSARKMSHTRTTVEKGKL